MRFEKLTQTIAAGGAWRLGMAAAELQIVASSFPLRVTLYRGGAVIGSGSNVLAGDYFRGVDFDFVELFSDAAQEVSILLSDGESGSNRIVGEVSVINGERSRTVAGLAHWGGVGHTSGVGLVSYVQLWNPAASNKRLVVSQIKAGVSVSSGGTGIVFESVAAAGLFGYGQSKLVGGGFSVGELRREDLAAAPVYPALVSSLPLVANAPETFRFSEPVMLLPGSGVGAVCFATAATMWANFEFYEEPI